MGRLALLVLCLALAAGLALTACGQNGAREAPANAQPRIEAVSYRDGTLVIDATDPDGTIVGVSYGVTDGPSGIADGGCGLGSPTSGWSVPLDLPRGTHRVRVTARSVVCDEGQPQAPRQTAARFATLRVR